MNREMPYEDMEKLFYMYKEYCRKEEFVKQLEGFGIGNHDACIIWEAFEMASSHNDMIAFED